MRKLATIQRIEEVQPIEGADAIEKVRIKEWWCVVRKGEFIKDQRVVYFEVDSLMPSSNPDFSFLGKGSKEKTMNVDGKEYKGYRLRTVKLRGTISQGLVISALQLFHSLDKGFHLDIGMDVSDQLGIVKYEPPIPAELSGTLKGSFPSYVPKTDEERVQNLSELIARDQGMKFYVTEKLDGASATYFTFDGEFRVCSRNWELAESGNTFWKIADRENLRERIPEGYAVQGEIIGEGIQGNPLKLTGQDLFIYNVYDIANSRYLNFEEFLRFCNTFNLKTVPIVMVDMALHFDVPKLLEMADGNSALGPYPREGLVFRPVQGGTTVFPDGTTQRYSFKVISNNYLLNHE